MFDITETCSFSKNFVAIALVWTSKDGCIRKDGNVTDVTDVYCVRGSTVIINCSRAKNVSSWTRNGEPISDGGKVHISNLRDEKFLFVSDEFNKSSLQITNIQQINEDLFCCETVRVLKFVQRFIS